MVAVLSSSMTSFSALSIIKKLQGEIPCSSQKGQELLSTLKFLNETLPFASFAIARVNAQGEVPSHQYFASENFPMVSPKTLTTAIHERQTQLDTLTHILLTPCLIGNEVVGVLMAHHITNSTQKSFAGWKTSERILVELSAQEISRVLAPSLPGLTTQNFSRTKTKTQFSAPPTLIGQSEKLKHILSVIDRVAPTMASVLILGESGTGKELIARRVHALSEQKNSPFVAINCGALSENLLESELFGHEKGAFTGASTQKKGLVEVAHTGTLFLDEIGEMPLSLQAKILRFLQEGVFYRVGGKEEIQVSVRVISATNRDLEAEVRAGKFREDLFYRLNTISIRSPALRERKEDIPLLMEHFSPGSTKLFTAEALEYLKNYPWPGNIRELQNMVERLKILSGGQIIGLNDLPHQLKNLKSNSKELQLSGPPPVDMQLDELERIHILRCLNHFEGNKTRAAQSLGITIKTLYNKLHRYGILDQNGV